MNLYEKSATKLSDLLKSKKVSAKEICDDTFNRIKNVDSKIECFLQLNEDDARNTAKIVDEKIAKGETLFPLEGVPISIKDNIAVKGLQNTCASKILENYISPYDATVTEKIKNNNMLITGKVNLDEFAMGSSCETSHYKITKNPYDLERVPGGSSGGSSACVASGQSTLSLGSDTGGSVRQPAAYCGVIGLKPTYGAVSRYGLTAFASSLDQIGTFARTVDDVAALQTVIAGRDIMDATSKEMDLSNLLGKNVDNITIGVPDEYFGEGINADVKEKVLNSIKELEKLGAKIKKISLPMGQYALSAYYIIASAEASSNLAKFDGVKYGYRTENAENIKDLFCKSRSEGFGDEVKKRILLGTYVLSSSHYDEYYSRAKLLQKQISDEYTKAFEECDVLITPTVPNTAFKIGEKISNSVEMYLSDICTVTTNIAGLPAISLPCGFDSNGLPIGMQIIGPKFSEATLLSTAKRYENIYGGFNKLVQI